MRKNQGEIQLSHRGSPLLKEENAAKPAKRLRAAEKDPGRNARSVLYFGPSPSFPLSKPLFYGGARQTASQPASQGHSNSWSELGALPRRSSFSASHLLPPSPLAALVLGCLAHSPARLPTLAPAPASRSPFHPCGKQRVKSRQVPRVRVLLKSRNAGEVSEEASTRAGGRAGKRTSEKEHPLYCVLFLRRSFSLHLSGSAACTEMDYLDKTTNTTMSSITTASARVLCGSSGNSQNIRNLDQPRGRNLTHFSAFFHGERE